MDKKKTFTKVIMSVILALAAIWITWSYILATISLFLYGNADPQTTLSEEVCRTIMGVIIGYCVKALAENISKYNFGKDETEDKSDSMAEG